MKLNSALIAISVMSLMAMSGSPVGAQAPNTGVVKIGLNEALSGALVGVGQPPAAGVRLAVKEINDKGGFSIGRTNYRLQLIEIDNQSTTASAVSGMIKLVGDDKVKFVFGPGVSTLASQAQAITVEAKAIHFSPAGSWQASFLTDPKRPLLFGTQVPTSVLATLDAEGFKQLGAKKVAFFGPDDDTTKGILPSFLGAMKTAGIEVVTILYPPNTTDFSIYVTRAKGENVEASYFLYPATSAPDLLRSIVELKASPKGFAGRALSPNVALKTGTGGPLPIPFFTTLNTPAFDYPTSAKMKAYTDRMRAFAPEIVGGLASFSFLTYDFVFMLVEAMKKAGTVDDTTKIAEALKSVTYDGAAGKMCFAKEMRTALFDGAQLFVKDGKVESKSFPSLCK